MPEFAILYTSEHLDDRSHDSWLAQVRPSIVSRQRRCWDNDYKDAATCQLGLCDTVWTIDAGILDAGMRKLLPDSDCEICKFRQLVLPIGKSRSEMSSVTIQNERIVTMKEIQDSEKSDSASSSSRSDQRIYIDIATEKVQDKNSVTSPTRSAVFGMMTTHRLQASYRALTSEVVTKTDNRPGR